MLNLRPLGTPQVKDAMPTAKQLVNALTLRVNALEQRVAVLEIDPTPIPDPDPPPPPPPPVVTGFPERSNTGVPAGTVLAPSGSIATTSDGQVIDSKDITGAIQVRHNNVTVKRTRIRRPDGVAILQDPTCTGLIVEDCELDGTGNTDGTAAVGFANFTIRRCNIHHYGEGITANGNTVIVDNYLHDFTDYVAQGAHQDGIQMEWGDNQLVQHNTIFQNVDGANSAIWVSAQSHSNVVIADNLVAGASFCVGAGNQATVTGNRISTRYYPNGGYYGPFTYQSGQMSGNVWHETGLPIES